MKAKSLDESRRAIGQARDAFSKKPPLPQGSPDTVPVQTVMSGDPQIVFPDLEANLRGLQSKKVADVVALDRMHDLVKGNDSLLIYYAGHGHQDKGFGGKGFWIPVDGMPPWATEKSPRTTWLPNSQVHDILQASRAKHILLISDSCYSGTFRMRSIGAPSAFAANLKYFYKLIGKESRRAITSGDLEPVADGGADGHSIFAYHLIKQLEQSGGPESRPTTFAVLWYSMLSSSTMRLTTQGFTQHDDVRTLCQ